MSLYGEQDVQHGRTTISVIWNVWMIIYSSIVDSSSQIWAGVCQGYGHLQSWEVAWGRSAILTRSSEMWLLYNLCCGSRRRKTPPLVRLVTSSYFLARAHQGWLSVVKFSEPSIILAEAQRFGWPFPVQLWAVVFTVLRSFVGKTSNSGQNWSDMLLFHTSHGWANQG